VALKEATVQAKLGANQSVMKYYKLETKGFVAKEILHHEFPDGKPKSSKPLPAGLQRHVDEIVNTQQNKSTWAQRYSDLENDREKQQAAKRSLQSKL
jgi:hypothetical protein